MHGGAAMADKKELEEMAAQVKARGAERAPKSGAAPGVKQGSDDAPGAQSGGAAGAESGGVTPRAGAWIETTPWRPRCAILSITPSQGVG